MGDKHTPYEAAGGGTTLVAPKTKPGVNLRFNRKTGRIVGVDNQGRMSTTARIVLMIVAIVAAVGWAMIALARGEQINSVWIVAAGVGSYIVAYTFYSRFIEYKLVRPRDDRATPSEYLADGTDFMPTDRRVLFGHHFAAIAGAGPLVGPVMAAQMGYLPSTLWLVIGVVLAGAVQDYLVLWISTRRRGRSLAQMVRDEMGTVGGTAAILAVVTIMLILIAVLALIVVNALADSPWGVFSIAMTIPIAFFMGLYLRFLRPGRIAEASVIGVILLLIAIISGGWVSETEWGARIFTLSPVVLAWCLIGYGCISALLPVWLLLAPRDYLATFMKVGVIVLLAVGIVIVAPMVEMPAVTRFAIEGDGPVFAGNLFPFLFITIACGALTGFHALVASGTTPKMVEKESQMRMLGYGSMLTESFVALTALVTAVILDRHMYFVMNAPEALTGGTPETAAAWVNSLGLPGQDLDPETLTATANAVGEESIISRTGGAPTLAVGMSQVLSDLFGSASMQAFWYHFAIMFEALFILTTVDSGTRVARFTLNDSLSNIPGLKKFGDPSWTPGHWVGTIVCCAAWGSILLMGVTDPLGGINVLFPLFGIANQLLAAIALALVLVVVVKKGYYKWAWIPAVPLVWDFVVTMTASWQKIFSSDPAMGFFAQHQRFKEAAAQGMTSFGGAETPEQIDEVIRNTMVQGCLSVLYPVLVLVVMVAAVATCWHAVRQRAAGQEVRTSEDEWHDSDVFAPSSMFATKLEKEIQAYNEELEQRQLVGAVPGGGAGAAAGAVPADGAVGAESVAGTTLGDEPDGAGGRDDFPGEFSGGNTPKENGAPGTDNPPAGPGNENSSGGAIR